MPTQVQLREYVEARLAALEKASDLAAVQLDKRLATMNEFREALKDQQQMMLTKNEYASRHDLLTNRIDRLEIAAAELRGKASQGAVNLATFLSFVGILLGIASLVVEIVRQGKP